MSGQLEAYFRALGDIGPRILASDGEGMAISLDAAIGWAVAAAEAIKRNEARVYFIGNGGSAGIASHMAIDWLKNGGFAAAAFNDGASLTCLANDLGFENVFAVPLSRHVRPGDLLCAISSSGKSADIRAAREKGAKVLTMSGFGADNPLRGLGDMNFYVPNSLYGFVEIAHLMICHAILDLSMGWRTESRDPACAAPLADAAP